MTAQKTAARETRLWHVPGAIIRDGDRKHGVHASKPVRIHANFREANTLYGKWRRKSSSVSTKLYNFFRLLVVEFYGHQGTMKLLTRSYMFSNSFFLSFFFCFQIRRINFLNIKLASLTAK